MKKQNRLNNIMDILNENANIKISEISKAFQVTEATARTDLIQLEKEGKLKRYHGGAYVIANNKDDLKLRKSNEHPANKSLIGKKAAEFVRANELTILDSGSTITQLANNISHMNDLNIITNSINIATIIGDNATNNVMISGGFFTKTSLSTSGEKACNFFSNISANKLFLAVGALSPTVGITQHSERDLSVKKAMMECAEKVYILADSSKIGRSVLFNLPIEWQKVEAIIVDQGIKSEDIQAFKHMGVNIIIA